jgi:membrane-associated phospholipid phosphatase
MQLLTVVVVFLIFNAVHTYLVYYTGKAHYGEGTYDVEIFDVGHRLLPDVHSQGWWLNSLIPLSLLVLIMARSDRGKVFRQLFRSACPLLLMRMITTLLTIPPPTKRMHTCRTDHPGFLHFLEGNCFDFLPSGHTIFVFTACAALFSVRSPVAFALILTQMVILILTRAHYTVDVVASAILAYAFECAGFELPI